MEIFEPLQTMIDIMNAYCIKLDEVKKMNKLKQKSTSMNINERRTPMNQSLKKCFNLCHI